MWKEVLSGIKEVFTQSEKTRQNTDDIKEFRRDLKELENRVEKLTVIVIQLSQEIQHHKTETAKDHENLALRLENEMLKFERRLSSGDEK
jgi:septal ring factor EnvC (AmiA/AmiB activator)